MAIRAALQSSCLACISQLSPLVGSRAPGQEFRRYIFVLGLPVRYRGNGHRAKAYGVRCRRSKANISLGNLGDTFSPLARVLRCAASTRKRRRLTGTAEMLSARRSRIMFGLLTALREARCLS